ncbi:hypothetical protein NQ317_008157 [Molorchus minor]|uniref:JmjC domain-containing protein n=1 Tax=Molorchus minor TaxID=1323400 RepID=A0ABQ9JIH7_9CUCU|nr:hypothetical protein NQ317_008157 [Molorchus minor]
MNSNPQDLKSLILNTNEPLIFKDVWNSKMLEWNLDKWREVLKDKELVFRSGVFEATNEPQWERKTESKKGSFEYFMEQTSSNSNWLYFDYKYLAEWFTDLADLRENISWALFGFPEKTADDSTIWIGSKGAHTPCHVDTYGFNLIHQVFGRKLWIIAPPDENLKPTRIPYEESSVYSRLNFFSPSDQEFKGR